MEMPFAMALSGFARPQRTRTPHLLLERGSGSERSREGAHLLLDSLARIVLAEQSSSRREHAGRHSLAGVVSDAGHQGSGGGSGGSPVPGVPLMPTTYEDVICSDAFMSPAIDACVRDGGEGSDALCQLTEHLCRGHEERSASVLREALRGVSSDSEQMATVSAQLLLHQLQLQDACATLRCTMALQRPHGLIGIVLEHIGGAAVNSSADDSTSAIFSEAARCYLCIRMVLEIKTSSKAQPDPKPEPEPEPESEPEPSPALA